MQMSFTPSVERLARRLFPGQVPAQLVAPERHERDTFTLEGYELRIIEQGHTDRSDTTSLYVPSTELPERNRTAEGTHFLYPRNSYERLGQDCTIACIRRWRK
jgi:hypothetical protein